MAAYQKFNAFVQDLGRKVHNLHTDTLKILLTNTAPVATNAVKADLTEISAANGYSAGGTTMTGTGWTQTSGTAKLAGANVVFTASGGSFGPLRYAVLYNDTSASDSLIGFWDYGGSITVTDGNTFTFAPSDTTNILQDV